MSEFLCKNNESIWKNQVGLLLDLVNLVTFKLTDLLNMVTHHLNTVVIPTPSTHV